MFRTLTVNDMVEGFVDNMPQKQIDEELRFFGKIARKLMLTRNHYGELGVVIDEDWSVSENEIAAMAGIFDYEPYTEKNKPSGYQFIYFRSLDDAERGREWIRKQMEEMR